MKNENSSANQKIKGKFVEREVVCLASMLISELASNSEYIDELLPVMVQDDWESAASDFINNMAQDEWGKTRDEIQEFCEENNIEQHQGEALEHWIVSDFLAAKLEAKGEMILDDFMGLTIWGRTCSGQAILLDGVISEICSDMEILDGQKYSWGPPEPNTEPLTKRLRQVRDALNKTKNRDVIEQIARLLYI